MTPAPISDARPFTTAGIVLAAGAGSRVGHEKALLRHGGRTFVAVCVDRMVEAGLDPVVAVVGSDAAAREAHEAGAEAARNPDPARGMLSSIHAALDALPRTIVGAVVHLVDHVTVLAETIRLIAEAGAPDVIVVPTYQGRRGHPIFFGRDLFEELYSAPPDVGARAVVRRDPDRIREVTVEDAGVARDIDTPEDLRDL